MNNQIDITHPIFSICIAAYKAEEYIEECLCSIAAQSFKDYEVIIVDDGSPKPLVIDSCILSKLTSCSIFHTENRGPYAARQKAFELANGEVFLCVDADDELLDSDALTKIYSALTTGADVVIYNAVNNKSVSTGMFDFSILGPAGLVKRNSVCRLFATSFSLNSMCCKAFKRSLYRASEDGAESRPRLLMAEDRLQSFEIMRNANSFYLINQPLYFYRQNSGSTTNAGYIPDYFRQSCYVENEIISILNESDIKNEDWAEFFLKNTSMCILGMKYNRTLRYQQRRSAYQSMIGEAVLSMALRYLNSVKLGRIDRMRLSLLKKCHYATLDLSMLPWKVGSIIKHLIR